VPNAFQDPVKARCFEVFDELKTWAEAKAYCMYSAGGYLAIIPNEPTHWAIWPLIEERYVGEPRVQINLMCIIVSIKIIRLGKRCSIL